MAWARLTALDSSEAHGAPASLAARTVLETLARYAAAAGTQLRSAMESMALASILSRLE
jgi:hypothetical protein